MGRLTYRNHENIPFMNYDGISDETTIRQSVIKLAAYEDAEEEGRLVVLPEIPDRCEMYLIYADGTADNPKTKIITLDFDNRWTISHGLLLGQLYRNGFNASFKASDIGKTVFFTREEAKAALKERETND